MVTDRYGHEIYPIGDYTDEFKNCLDKWWSKDTKEMDILMIQGRCDSCKTSATFSWTYDSCISTYRAYDTYKDWSGYNREDIVILDHSNIGAIKMTNLLEKIQMDGVKKVIVIIGTDFKHGDFRYEDTPKWFKDRSYLFTTGYSLLK